MTISHEKLLQELLNDVNERIARLEIESAQATVKLRDQQSKDDQWNMMLRATAPLRKHRECLIRALAEAKIYDSVITGVIQR